MIALRELKEKDAPFMLEWMHDADIQTGFKKDMLNARLEDAEQFCKDSCIPKHIENEDDLHFAITNEDDEYLGTISLKDIDLNNRRAEYAIVLRKSAQHKGVAYEATMAVLKKAFTEYGLNRVFLSVYENNQNAIKLYERCGFKYEGEFREHFIHDGKALSWKWYSILKSEYNE